MQSGWSEIRPVRVGDLGGILQVELVAMPAPWSEKQVKAELEAPNGRGWVVEEEGRVAGYAFFRACLPECELLHLVVLPARRRCGIAQTLLQQALTSLVQAGCRSCLLEVRDSNMAARQLYTKMGFFQVGRRKNYYRQPIEDALLMQWGSIE